MERGLAMAYWVEQRASVRMMDEWSWTSEMGEEDEESSRRWCVGSMVRMMDERSWASKMGEKDDESGQRWWNGRGIKEIERWVRSGRWESEQNCWFFMCFWERESGKEINIILMRVGIKNNIFCFRLSLFRRKWKKQFEYVEQQKMQKH